MWTDKYIGIPYKLESTNCGWLVQTVLRDEFGIEITIPSEAEDHFARRSMQVSETLFSQFEKIDEKDARDGDIVLMKVRGRLAHVGIYVKVGLQRYVLHTTKGSESVLQSMNHIKSISTIRIEGIYRFTDK